ncbi:MAG: BrxA/BrxB family bacilliredoxin [Candidatus Eisenbacteria bacterium]|nr:BrxA/BrxB family bacilliredoxin [Candidatus Latescibacterota bacterium]MBD3302513.1 BrxA/BrxB family bacilliredoxin [Candidatus Eisenbacteria bacterium]
MPYPEEIVAPMRQELIRMGVRELRTPPEVDTFLESQEGTAMVFVNSVCGCAAGSARPGLALSLTNDKRPARVATVFAGQDVEATERARKYFNGHAPSSPAAALFRDGRLVHLLQRHDIEGRSPQEVGQALIEAYEQHC